MFAAPGFLVPMCADVDSGGCERPSLRRTPSPAGRTQWSKRLLSECQPWFLKPAAIRALRVMVPYSHPDGRRPKNCLPVIDGSAASCRRIPATISGSIFSAAHTDSSRERRVSHVSIHDREHSDSSARQSYAIASIQTAPSPIASKSGTGSLRRSSIDRFGIGGYLVGAVSEERENADGRIQERAQRLLSILAEMAPARRPCRVPRPNRPTRVSTRERLLLWRLSILGESTTTACSADSSTSSAQVLFTRF